jgi:predicted  nucleic acid-binding Zn-ribbon protein
MSAEVILIQSRFDPATADAEATYDRVVARLARLRAQCRRLEHAYAELERQFVTNDLVVHSGPRRGKPLTAAGRRRRLDALLDLGHELKRAHAERDHVEAELAHMTEALEHWVRRTWGA